MARGSPAIGRAPPRMPTLCPSAAVRYVPTGPATRRRPRRCCTRAQAACTTATPAAGSSPSGRSLARSASEGTAASADVVSRGRAGRRVVGAMAAMPFDEWTPRAHQFLRVTLRSIPPWRWPAALWLYRASGRTAPEPPGTLLLHRLPGHGRHFGGAAWPVRCWPRPSAGARGGGCAPWRSTPGSTTAAPARSTLSVGLRGGGLHAARSAGCRAACRC